MLLFFSTSYAVNPAPIKHFSVSGLINFNNALYVSGYHNQQQYGEDQKTFIYVLTEDKKLAVLPHR